MQHDTPTSSESQPAPGGTDPTRSSKKLWFVLVATGISAVLFVVLDLALGGLVDFQKQKSFRTSHPYYHHGLQPNQQRLTTWGRQRYEMTTNSLGFRDDQVRDVPLRSGGRRIVLIGDSMIEGLGVEFDDTVAGQLRARWSDQDVEVLNAGVVSYSPRLYELRTRYLLEEVGLEFDALVVFIDISDIQDETFYERFQPGRDPASVGARRGWWRRRSLVANVVERLFSSDRRINNRFRTDADVDVWMEGTEAYVKAERDPEQGRFEWTVNESAYRQWGERGLALARKHMARLGELCREHQIEMSVVVYPSPVQIYASDRDSRQTRFWRDFCEESGDHFIDLFPTFIDRRYSGPADVYRKYFIADDVHWNVAGHRLVAGRVGDELDVF